MKFTILHEKAKNGWPDVRVESRKVSVLLELLQHFPFFPVD